MQLYQMIKNLIILILLITIIVAIVLLITKMILQNYFNKIVEQSTLTTIYARIFNKDIKELNQNIKALEKIQKEYISWINFFIEFSKLVPADIILYHFDLNKEKILITGLAKTRDELLKFKENLASSFLFSEVEIPLENLLKKESIDFNIKASINLNKLKKHDN